MIFDSVSNMSLYKCIPDEAVNFIQNLSVDVIPAKYEITPDIFASVSEYSPKSLNEAKFEAHKKYIDIQLLLRGSEKIYFTDKSKLCVDIPYNSDDDIEFFSEQVAENNFVVLDGTNFVMLYPHEAHAPQVKYDSHFNVKKVVIKIKI